MLREQGRGRPGVNGRGTGHVGIKGVEDWIVALGGEAQLTRDRAVLHHRVGFVLRYPALGPMQVICEASVAECFEEGDGLSTT